MIHVTTTQAIMSPWRLSCGNSAGSPKSIGAGMVPSMREEADMAARARLEEALGAERLVSCA